MKTGVRVPKTAEEDPVQNYLKNLKKIVQTTTYVLLEKMPAKAVAQKGTRQIDTKKGRKKNKDTTCNIEETTNMNPEDFTEYVMNTAQSGYTTNFYPVRKQE